MEVLVAIMLAFSVAIGWPVGGWLDRCMPG